MRPLRWVLLQKDWCPNKKRKFGDRDPGDACAQKKGRVWTQQEDRLPVNQGERHQEKPG